MRQRVTIRPTPAAKWSYPESYLSKNHTITQPIQFEGDFELEVEELGHFVRVRPEGSSATYTYEDPTGELQVGDLVDVPFGSENRLRIARVTALGRGVYVGPVKAVAAKLHREALA